MPPKRATTIDDALDAAAEAITASPAVEVWQEWAPRSDAEELLSEVLGRRITLKDLQKPMPEAAKRKFAALVKRRVAGEPVPLIVGYIEFAGIEIHTKRGVFVPRLSTEFAALDAAKRLRRFSHPIAVDVATGSGPIALTLADRVPNAEVYGLDIAADAVALGRENAKRLGFDNVHFMKSDILRGLPKDLLGEVAVITIHPPYVARDEVKDLPGEIRNFEPVHTLTDKSDDGLGLVRMLLADVMRWLRPGGWLMVEVGPYLARKTQTLMRRAGLTDVVAHADDIGVTRAVWGRKPR